MRKRQRLEFIRELESRFHVIDYIYGRNRRSTLGSTISNLGIPLCRQHLHAADTLEDWLDQCILSLAKQKYNANSLRAFVQLAKTLRAILEQACAKYGISEAEFCERATLGHVIKQRGAKRCHEFVQEAETFEQWLALCDGQVFYKATPPRKYTPLDSSAEKHKELRDGELIDPVARAQRAILDDLNWQD